jgi:hypothetical protein
MTTKTERERLITELEEKQRDYSATPADRMMQYHSA